MGKIISKDGTAIAFSQSGEGDPVILVDGALCYRAFGPMEKLAALLSKHFRVFTYDRRGRGESGDNAPYALEREIEDLEALIDEAGGSTFVFGISSGAALVLEAAISLGDKVKKLALYEAPYDSDEAARQRWKAYRKQLAELLTAGRKGDAVALFMMLVGMPAEHLEGVRQQPMWPLFEAIGHTLAYDAAALGEDGSVPIERVTNVSMPALIMDGAASFPFMHVTAVELTKALPNGELRTLEGQTHEVEAEILAPVLEKFYLEVKGEVQG